LCPNTNIIVYKALPLLLAILPPFSSGDGCTECIVTPDPFREQVNKYDKLSRSAR
jgi:hypothetical protein